MKSRCALRLSSVPVSRLSYAIRYRTTITGSPGGREDGYPTEADALADDDRDLLRFFRDIPKEDDHADASHLPKVWKLGQRVSPVELRERLLRAKYVVHEQNVQQRAKLLSDEIIRLQEEMQRLQASPPPSAD